MGSQFTLQQFIYLFIYRTLDLKFWQEKKGHSAPLSIQIQIFSLGQNSLSFRFVLPDLRVIFLLTVSSIGVLAFIVLQIFGEICQSTWEKV